MYENLSKPNYQLTSKITLILEINLKKLCLVNKTNLGKLA